MWGYGRAVARPGKFSGDFQAMIHTANGVVMENWNFTRGRWRTNPKLDLVRG